MCEHLLALRVAILRHCVPVLVPLQQKKYSEFNYSFRQFKRTLHTALFEVSGVLISKTEEFFLCSTGVMFRCLPVLV